MLVPIIVLVVGVLMIWAECREPGRHWPRVKGWWGRALLFNVFQAAVVYGFGIWWESSMPDTHLWSMDGLGTLGATLVGYLVMTFIYYWWHRARHEVHFLWRWFHQLHHSPQRLEVVTSFYKHPFEVVANAVLSAIVMYCVMGLSAEAVAGVALLAGLAELFYHWNIKTPHWLGYIIQRPESHCAHHEEGLHHRNYADLPIWDMLFGTFHNPETFEGKCGFGDKEHDVQTMLRGADVYDPAPVPYRWRLNALAVIGLAGMAGTALGSPAIQAIAAATASSPAPKVFTTQGGMESFSTKFLLVWTDQDGQHEMPLDYDNYGKLDGPYNRRNVYGAVLAAAPMLIANPHLKPMFDDVSVFGLCPENGAPILRELGVDVSTIDSVSIQYFPLPGMLETLPRIVKIDCDGGQK